MLDSIVKNPIIRVTVTNVIKSALEKNDCHGLYIYMNNGELDVKAFERNPEQIIFELRVENERLNNLVNYLSK
jgi:hypothetical protein